MKLIKKIVLCAVFCLLIFIVAKCDSTEPPIEAHGLVLELEDVSSTEVWISLITANLQLPTTVTLKQNDQTRSTINLVKADTLLYIDSLLPNTNHTFKSIAQQINQTEVTSNVLSITTMDTTSHNFTWQVFTFGNPNYRYSVLRDVSIINENYIWVVGEVYLLDSLGQTDTQVYGAGYWNGSEWDIMKVPYSDYGNPRPAPSPGPVLTISTINNRVFVTSYANLLEYNNENWIERAFFIKDLSFNGQVVQMYAYNEDNIFCVGRNGAIYHVTSSGWDEIESGTETYLSDIWGTIESTDGEQIKYITGLHLQPQDETKLLSMNGQNIVQDLNWNINSDLSSVWANKSFPIYVGGNQLFTNKTGDWEQIPGISFQYYITCIRGSALNDIAICGTLGLIAHYNGVDWITYDQISPGAIFSSIEISGNTICAVGELGRDAIIVLGRRN